MRWPDIFFKARKRPEQTGSKSPQEGALKVASTVTSGSGTQSSASLAETARIANPAPAKPGEPYLNLSPSSGDPALTPAVLADDAPLSSRAERVISPSEHGTSTTGASTVSIPAPPSGPTAESGPAPISEPSPTSESNPAAPSVAPTIRRKAKLTDLARMIPSTESIEPEPLPEPPSAVSPPAFNVAVPIGKDLPENKVDRPILEKAEGTVPTSGPAPVPPASALTPKSEAAKPATPLEHLPAKASEKKEFLLVNGERIWGNVLSETPDTIYLEHGTLGVLTLPRSQIATRPVEIILINGDRIVGDIMAETPENLYVRHASLGMLTVPRAQRSTRVVEAILKDGDRILGEVLAETENSTVIRSSTLGTVTVPHDKISMLNRKLEQVTLKALPNAAVALEDKPKA